MALESSSPGYGASFGRLDAALAYAQARMHELHFQGIYCERDGLEQYWRFDYVDGAAVWAPLLDSASTFASRAGALRPGATLVAVAAADSKAEAGIILRAVPAIV